MRTILQCVNKLRVLAEKISDTSKLQENLLDENAPIETLLMLQLKYPVTYMLLEFNSRINSKLSENYSLSSPCVYLTHKHYIKHLDILTGFSSIRDSCIEHKNKTKLSTGNCQWKFLITLYF